MTWPFKSKPDTRPATDAARAVAESLRSEPNRWKLQQDRYLEHDSGICIDAYGWIRRPNLDDEPSANAELVALAVDAWVAAQMKLPPKPEKEATKCSAT